MNIRIPYIMNPTHEGKYSTTVIIKNGKTKKRANIIYRALAYRPRLVIYEDDIFA
mgnify:CR=1 FL=1